MLRFGLHGGIRQSARRLMNRIGLLIEERRCHLGLSRQALADILDVSAQTVLSVERDPDYNIGTRLLCRLEAALRVEFRIDMKEDVIVNDRVRFGNDELILHIRKHHPCRWSNDQLGKKIWVFLRDHAGGEKIAENVPVVWDTTFRSRKPDALPLTSALIEFNADALPPLFRFLRELAERQVIDDAD